jgi:hypothetical protein
VQAIVWDRYDDPDQKKVLITDFDNIRVKQDGMVVVIAFVPKDTDVPLPESAINLPELGAVDGGAVPPTTTVAGATTTTVAGESGTTTTVAEEGSATTTVAEGDAGTTTTQG